MRILIISEAGEGLPFAIHSTRKWTQIKMYNLKGAVGDGMVEFTDNPVREARDTDVALITSHKLTDFHKQINKWCPTIGGSLLEYQLNTDQSLCVDLYKLGGGSLPSSPPKDYHEILVGAWHGRGGWKLPAVIGMVYKGLFPKDKGIGIEGVGVVVTSDYSRKLFTKLLKPFSQPLARSRYNGFLVVKAAFDGIDIYPTSVSAGLDSYLIPAVREITKSSLPSTIQTIVSPHKPNSNILPNYGIAVMISIPPFPYQADKVDNVEIENYNSNNEKHLWMLDVNKPNGIMRCAGSSGAICYATSFGKTVKEARRRVYRTVDRLSIPQAQFRNDIGETFPQTYESLLKIIQ